MLNQQFCGSPLWDANLTWYTDTPQFTQCFKSTVLTYTPALVLLLTLPLDLYSFYTSPYRTVPWGAGIITRLVITLILALLSFSQILLLYLDSFDEAYISDIVAHCVCLVWFSVSFSLTLASKHYGQVTSPPQFLFWLSFVICQIFSLTSSVLSKTGRDAYGSTLSEDLSLVVFGLGGVMLILNMFADSPPEYTELSRSNSNPSPVNTASFFSKMTISWLDGLIKTGWKRTVVPGDLWNTNYNDSYEGIVPKFEKYLEKYGGLRGNKSILLPLVACFWHYFLYSTICQVILIFLQMINPQILNLLIVFVEEREEMWKGILYVVLMVVTSIVTGIFDSWSMYILRLMTMRVMVPITASVYKKTLVLSAAARKNYTTGDIVNLIAVDCGKIEECVLYIINMVTTPIYFIVTIYFVWPYLGYSVLVGVAVLFFLIPLNIVCWNALRNYQNKQMTLKDIRVNLINEVLNGIKVLKLYSWEKSFIEKLSEIRNREINNLKKFQFIDSFLIYIYNMAVFFVSLASFTAFVLIDPVNNILDPKTAFVSLTLIKGLKRPIFKLPFAITSLIQAKVSLTRINKFLNAEELDANSITHESLEFPLMMDNASFKWDSEQAQDTLRDITFNINHGSLVAVVGQVGAGKSSLLSALLGEMQRTSGHANMNGSIAYVAQQAWIRNMTVKNNILSGKRLSQKAYHKVIEACALKQDLEMLPGGDETEIGEKGINLSGGQKQRINLARAVYANRDIYLLDDPLSAVDAHVGKHIFDKVIGPKGCLNKKTRILVTHGIGFLPHFDQIIVLKDGAIVEKGSYVELMNNKGSFSDFVFDQLQNSQEPGNTAEHLDLDVVTPNKDMMLRKEKKKHHISESEVSAITDTLSLVSSMNETKESNNIGALKINTKKNLIEEEFVEESSVKLSIYLYYTKSCGILLGVLAILFYLLFEAFIITENLWLSQWSDDPLAATDILVRNMYLIGYGAIGGIESILLFIGLIFFTIGSLKASIKLHDNLVNRILRSPMSFFDTTPIGRIVNRFSKDTDEVDITLPFFVKDTVNFLVNVMGSMLILCFISPIILSAIVPLVLLFILLQKVYLATSRQLKRLMSVSRSPINSHLEESLTGANTIRAFGIQDMFIKENEEKIEQALRCRYPECLTNNWVFIRLQVVATLLIFGASLITVLNRDTIDPGLAGLSLSYALTCPIDIFLLVRSVSDLEKSIVSVERIKEYTEVTQEAPQELTSDANYAWPKYGHIVFHHYSTRYRPGLDLVLDNINCEIQAGEKIGIVGRTGAGKSSITLSLFRIIEAASGEIRVDDVNIAHIGLAKLRSGLTIIPQDPVLYSGSLRFNLDPFDQHNDSEIWRAIELSHMGEMVKNLEGGLNHIIAEGGSNLSVGQRQLLCLVRALLRKTTVLVLDEATAAIDLETDDLIQATIRQEFRHSTVMTIAHRLKTVLDSDRVMVMDKGAIKEFADPQQLLMDRSSLFYDMAKNAGLVE